MSAIRDEHDKARADAQAMSARPASKTSLDGVVNAMSADLTRVTQTFGEAEVLLQISGKQGRQERCPRGWQFPGQASLKRAGPCQDEASIPSSDAPDAFVVEADVLELQGQGWISKPRRGEEQAEIQEGSQGVGRKEGPVEKDSPCWRGR